MTGYDHHAARSKHITIRTEHKNPNLFQGQLKLDPLPAAKQQRSVGNQAGQPRSEEKLRDESPVRPVQDRHFSSADRQKRSKLVTYWRTRGSHELALEQKRSLAGVKDRQAREMQLIQRKREAAKRQMLIEKKHQAAELRGEVYDPDEDDDPLINPPGERAAREADKENDFQRTFGKKANRGKQEDKKKAEPSVAVGPKGEPLPDNVAFLGEQVDENRSSKLYKYRNVQPSPTEYKRQTGLEYRKRQRDFNTYNPLYCLCVPVYRWSRTDLLGDLTRQAEAVIHMLQYKASQDGEPVYLLGNYRVGDSSHHSLWFPVTCGLYVWFNVLDDEDCKYLLDDMHTFLQFPIDQSQGTRLSIHVHALDVSNNDTLRRSRSKELPHLESDSLPQFQSKSSVFSTEDSSVSIEMTRVFEAHKKTGCLLWVTLKGKSWLGNAWASVKRPQLVFKPKPEQTRGKKQNKSKRTN